MNWLQAKGTHSFSPEVFFQELNDEQIVNLAPAAGATEPAAKCSEKYSFVPTLQAVDLLRDSGWYPMVARQSRVVAEQNNGFQRHQIIFSKREFNLGEEIIALSLDNSHNTGSAFWLNAAIIRILCANLARSSSDIFSYSHKHIGFSPDKFVSSAKQISDSAGLLADSIDDFKAVELDDVERRIFAESAYFLGPKSIEPQQLLEARRGQDKGNDLWRTYNVCQENIVRGGLKGRSANGRRVRTRPVQSIERDTKLNQALWTLTEKMAELKGAA